MADFTGFSYGGRHSSDLGIIRVSSGDRYEESLHPEIKDKTVEVSGLTGNYYFGSDFGTRTFNIEFVFDHLTEEQFRELRKVFGTKDTQELIFDERPYKKYLAKVESPVELSYVCFDEPVRTKFSETSSQLPDGVRWVKNDQNQRVKEKVDPWVYGEGTERIYKGEGKVTFICYFPFAKSVFKVLPSEGSEEWATSSGILSAASRSAMELDVFNDGLIKVYNPGDVDTGFRLYIPAAAAAQQTTLYYRGVLKLRIDPIQLKSNSTGSTDAGVIIDTNTELINGLVSPITDSSIDQNGNVSYTTSGNIYNEYIKIGSFFKLQPNNYGGYSTLHVVSTGTGFQIFYDYLYF